MTTLYKILDKFYNFVMDQGDGKLHEFQINDFIEKEGKEFEGETIDTELKSKGNWEFERSSGYPGYRCQTCMKWVYSHEVPKCNCDI
jgi:hypothetical protein